MALTGQVEYRVLYNNFLKQTKDYSEFINSGFVDLYTQYGNGILEETFETIEYEWGNIMDTGMNIVGFPKNGLKRLDDRYVTLQNAITAGTTNLQLQLPTGANKLDKEYVEEVLLKHAKKSWLNLRSILVQFLIELRDRQLNLSNNIDKLNLVSSNVAGYLSGASAGGMANFNLTTGTSITNLISDVTTTTNKLEKFCAQATSNIALHYRIDLTYPNEYLFFIDKLMTNKITEYVSSHTLYDDAKKLINYRSDELIKDLTKHRRKYTKGINKEISEEYKTNILKFAITLLDYDCKKYKKYFDKDELPLKLKEVKGIPKALDKFEVNFTQTESELSLVRRFFDSTVFGTNNSSYNLKITKNITIT